MFVCVCVCVFMRVCVFAPQVLSYQISASQEEMDALEVTITKLSF